MEYPNLRVRFAPSPTGFVHIGSLRTMLYIFLAARHYNGKFIVRIEDTDRTRLVPGAVENMIKVLEWAGIDYDEGPYLDNGEIKQKGEFGPYYQSERLDIYSEQIQDLVDKNKAYYCFCGKERLENLRAKQTENKLPTKYDGLCRNLSKKEVDSLLAQGAEHVIRFKTPEEKTINFVDEIRGAISVNSNDLDDFVLIKSDKYPTYHFANVVDDHFMKISLVLRGDEWISTTPYHVLLYEAFGWTAPKLAHLPLLVGSNHKKLSKRVGDVSVSDFIDKGYIKEALINFIALLGWNSGTEQEIYSLNELCKQFSIDHIHKAPAVFDLEKLDWLNGIYIRNLSLDDFYSNCLPFLEKAELLKQVDANLQIVATGELVKPAYVKNILSLEQSRVKKLAEIGESVAYFFIDKPAYEPTILVWKKSDAATTKQNLSNLLPILMEIEETDFTKETIEKKLMAHIERSNLTNGEVLWPLRVSLSGRDKSPGPFELAAALGKEKTLARIQLAITRL